jgi:hypothetical protein
MKRFILACLLIAPLILSSALAETTGQLGGMDSDGNYHWTIDDDGTLTGNSNAELKLNDIELTNWGTSIHFGPGDFTAADAAETTVAEITSVSAPHLDIQNRKPCLVWDDAEESYAQVTFKVPADYVSGGSFRAFVDYDTGANSPSIEYRVLVDSDGSAWDTAWTVQDAVDPGGTAGTPELVALPITTDFASLAAGDVVTFAIARDDDDASTAKMELYYVEFYYNE